MMTTAVQAGTAAPSGAWTQFLPDGPEAAEGYSTSELWQAFRTEIAQHVSAMRRQLAVMEAMPTATEPLRELRRSAHTLKGTAAMMGFEHVAQLAHRIEDTLDEATISPLLSEMIRVLEELSGGQRDAVAVQPVPQNKPFAAMHDRLQQTVRQAAHAVGKKVHLVIDDAGVEMEATLWDDVGEILLHLLRNAVDHGIELADVRDRRSKPETGSILVTASYEHTRIVLQVIDDGRGLNPDEIRQTAVAKGLVSDEQAASLSQEELFDMLLKPGFSTASSVTELSGRGMGLDIVNTRVAKRRGTLLVESEYRRGTCIVMCIPTKRSS